VEAEILVGLVVVKLLKVPWTGRLHLNLSHPLRQPQYHLLPRILIKLFQLLLMVKNRIRKHLLKSLLRQSRHLRPTLQKLHPPIQRQMNLTVIKIFRPVIRQQQIPRLRHFFHLNLGIIGGPVILFFLSVCTVDCVSGIGTGRFVVF